MPFAPTMRPIEQLAALQAIDSTLDADRHRYVEIQGALHEPASLAAARTGREEAAAQLHHWRRERQQREIAVSDQQTRIQAQEKQLYGNRVKDAREQVALQQNVEMLKRQLTRLEEAALDSILELEQAEVALVHAENLLAAETATWQKGQTALQSERETLITRARHTKAQRDTSAARLAPDLLKRYETLRQKHGGIAVSKIQGSNCGVCGAAVPTSVRQQAHGEALAPCPICGRLLYI